MTPHSVPQLPFDLQIERHPFQRGTNLDKLGQDSALDVQVAQIGDFRAVNPQRRPVRQQKCVQVREMRKQLRTKLPRRVLWGNVSLRRDQTNNIDARRRGCRLALITSSQSTRGAG